VYQALNVAARSTVLLPNMQELVWCPEDDAIFPYVSLFLGPNILRIRLSLKNSGVIGPSLLPTLRSRSPSLRCLKLFGYNEPTVAASEALSVAMCGWTQLRNVEVEELAYEALINLGRLPCLRQLSCTLVRDSIPAPIPLSLNSSWFPVLSYLFLRCRELTPCSFLVETLSSAPISHFGIRHSGSSDPLGYRHLFDALGHCNPSTLVSIKLNDIIDPSARATNGLPVGNIRPLFVFSCLTFVDLSLREGIDIDDAGMEELAKAWPRLQSFSMMTRLTLELKPRVTLAGLIPLAKYCRNLSMISVNVNACEVTISKSRPGKGIINAECDSLCIGDSPIEHPVAVAAFLSDIFSEIPEILKFNGDDVDESSKWSQVVQLIPTFTSIRLQERNYRSEDKTSGDEAGDQA
jgi:hypothetical protein